MKGVRAQYPFEDYNLYKQYSHKDDRYYAILYPRDGIGQNKRLTMSYARYLMCVKEQRIIREDETVDHIDENRTNDSLDNLQILTIQQNQEKYATNRVTKKMVVLKCPICESIFEKPYNKCKLFVGRKRSQVAYCSRECLHIATSRINKSETTYEELSNGNVVKIYNKPFSTADH